MVDEKCAVFIDVVPDPATKFYVIVLFGIIYSLMFLLGVIGNGLVILLTVRNASLQTVQNIFILNLAASDLIVCFVSLPVTPITNIFKNWYFGVALCHLLPWVQGVSVFICTFSLSAIAVDRYVLIVHPHVKLLSKRGAMGVTVVLWVLSVLVTLPYTIFMDVITHEGLCGEFCTEMWPSTQTRAAYTLFVMAAQFVLPFAIMAVCYWMIFARLRVRARKRLQRMSERSVLLQSYASPQLSGPSSTSLNQTPSTRSRTRKGEGTDSPDRQRQQLVRQTRRTTIILFCMVLIFGLTWLPHNALSVVMEFNETFFEIGETNLLYLVNLFTHRYVCISLGILCYLI
uniref:G-protein coupled receptors family 1 profile domain-containing protein n=1 Tax=Plectus sambesii TaxID=2011161 RepID=A0A914WAK7_9BILA